MSMVATVASAPCAETVRARADYSSVAADYLVACRRPRCSSLPFFNADTTSSVCDPSPSVIPVSVCMRGHCCSSTIADADLPGTAERALQQ